jgi:hypothetical protein
MVSLVHTLCHRDAEPVAERLVEPEALAQVVEQMYRLHRVTSQ